MTDKQRKQYVAIKEKSTNKYIGKRYGRLMILGFSYEKRGHHKYFECKCDCGEIKIISLSHMQSNKIKSCGCLWEDNKHEYKKIHGGSKDKLYQVWESMRKRCNNPNEKAYINYGSRGITVCKEWDNYSIFKEWSFSHGYTHGLVIDRINNDKGYSPDNCRWVTVAINNRNKRSNIILTHNGITMILADWSKKIGLSRTALSARINKLGWSVDEALDTPLLKNRYERNISKHGACNE